MVPKSASYTFNHDLTHVGPVPQNTGVSSVDYNTDRIIGTEASERWETVEARNAYKRDILRGSPGTGKDDLSVLPSGDYRIMGKQEKTTIRNTRAFHNLASGLRKSKERYQLLKQASHQGT